MANLRWDSLQRRITFVVGKGGVGKSTSAVDLAEQLASQGHTIHLVSTDPAHSLRDLHPRDQPNLTIEEFDASAYADAWLGRARTALLQVIERGTYLDVEDGSAFLDLSLPGVDEVMAALRLVEIERTSADRIVVDTAPTGHTLRLLDAADIIESWTGALEAMVAKADAVAIGLVGQSPAWPALQLIQQWRAAAQAFRSLIRAADFVVITRADAVVQAETERLRNELNQRGLHVAQTITVSQAATKAVAAETSRRPDPLRRDHSAAEWFRSLGESLLLCAGKGGVGKSTCAAAIALVRAAAEQTCLVSTDPAGSLGDVLALSIGNDPVEVNPGLHARQLDAHREYERLRSRYADDVKRVFEQLGLSQAIALDRNVIERLWNLAPPGIDEIIALTEIIDASEECSALIIDSAPTGHFLRLLAMPEIAVDWSHALLRVLLKYQVAGALEDFSREVLTFARDARRLRERLTTSGNAGVVLVTLDEPVVWAETERLHATLSAAQIPVTAVVINRADDGAPGAHPDFARSARIIRAPLLETAPVGRDRLRDFIDRWEFIA